MKSGYTSAVIRVFPTKIEIIIMVIPILMDWPVRRIVPVVAEAIPR